MKFGQWIGLIIFLISLYVLWQIRQLAMLIFTAIVLANALNLLVKQLQRVPRWGLRRGGAVFLSISLLVVLLVLFFWIVVPAFIEQFQQLIALVPAGVTRLEQWLLLLEQRFLSPEVQLPDPTAITDQVGPFIAGLLGGSVQFFTTSVNAVVDFLIVLVITLMILLNPQPYRHGFVRLFPSFYRYRIEEILDRCETVLTGWTKGALIEMLFIGFFSGLGLWILQVPLVLAHAVLAGLLNFIPNIGPTLSAVFPIAVALVDAPWKALAVLVLYLVIQNVESFWLTPTVMAKQVELLPAVTLTAQIFFASFFGALGLLMAIPLTVVAKTWIEEVFLKDVMDNWERRPS